MKKFSIGLSLLNCSKKEWIKIIDKYKEFISYIYYSPNEEGMFSRGDFEGKVTNINDKEQYEILEYAKLNGIKTELAINTKRKINKSKLKTILLNEKEKNNHDYVVTYNNYIDIVSEIFKDSKFTLSYNEGIFSDSDLEKIDKRFSTIILGNRWLRVKPMFEKVKSLGFDTELLVNNGCSHNCNYCFSENEKDLGCEFFFNMNISRHDINVITAINTVFPNEIYNQYEKWNCIDNYKLSTRPQTYKQICFLLENFTKGLEIKDYIESYEEFHSLLNLSHYTKFMPFINLKDVKSIKEKEWSIINGNNK